MSKTTKPATGLRSLDGKLSFSSSLKINLSFVISSHTSVTLFQRVNRY